MVWSGAVVVVYEADFVELKGRVLLALKVMIRLDVVETAVMEDWNEVAAA